MGATVIGQMLIGEAHATHGNILPTHHMLLIEGDSGPSVLELSGRGARRSRRWVPRYDKTMLEDALVMAGLLAFKDEDVVRVAEEIASPDRRRSSRVERRFIPAEYHRLVTACQRMAPERRKVILTLGERSILNRQCAVIEQYQISIVICTPCYARYNSLMGNGIYTLGSAEKCLDRFGS